MQSPPTNKFSNSVPPCCLSCSQCNWIEAKPFALPQSPSLPFLAISALVLKHGLHTMFHIVFLHRREISEKVGDS